MSEIFSGLLLGLGQALAFFYDLIPSYGIAIILLTVAVRLAMLPLTIKQTRSMLAMQKLSPEIKKIQAKHKGDRQKLTEEMSKLYKEHGANPLGGCLPLVLQLPVFIALYRVFSGCGRVIRGVKGCAPNYIGVQYLPVGSALRRAIIGGEAGFLGMSLGLSPSEAFRGESVFGAIPYGFLILLMAATTWYQQRQTQVSQDTPQAAQMRMIGRIMPLMLAVFSINLPAGVTVYWVASNLWTIGQQHLLLGKRGGSGPLAGAAPSERVRGSDGGERQGAPPAKAKTGNPSQRQVGARNPPARNNPSSKNKNNRSSKKKRNRR